MKKIYFIYLLCFLGTALQAQKARVTGQVVDVHNQSPLSYATISIYEQGTEKLINGGISDDKGRFVIELPYGKYYATVEFIAFQTRRIEDISLDGDRPRMDLGILLLENVASDLDEVVVQAERSTLELALDKRVFNVGKDLGNAGGSAMELLSNVPSVTVDTEGQVRLRGSDNVRILIDGKPSGLVSFKGGAGLQQLQASLVEKVEVITNPSARYEAEGMAGIINIVLKKERKQGFNGSFEVTTGYPVNFGGAANLNYRHNKVNFFINYGINYRKIPSIYTVEQEVYNGDTTLISDHSYDGEHIGFFNNIQGGLDFYFDEKNILTASYLYSRSKGKRLTDLRYNDYLQNRSNLTSYTLRTQDEDEIEPISEYQLSFKKKFDKEKQELNAEIRYMDHWEDSDQLFTQRSFSPEGIALPGQSIIQTSFNEETERQLLAQVDYFHPFGQEGKLEAGLRGSFRDMTNDYVVNQKDASGNEIPLEGLDNNFTYAEDISAAYAILGNKSKKLSYQAGLRYEWTSIETILEETRESNPRKYGNLFPSAHISYDLPKGHAIQLSYSRRVRRPVYNELSPFVTFSDNRNFWSGNPDLNPEFSDVIELGHIKYFDKASFASSIYYRYTDGKIEKIREVDDRGFSNTIPENLDLEHAFGVDLTSSYQLKSWWKMDVNFNFFRAITDGKNISPELYSDTYTWFVQYSSRFNVSKSSDFQFRANYEAPQLTPQGERKAIYFIDLAFRQDILQGKGKLTLNVSDLFNSKRVRIVTRGDNFYMEGDNQRRRRQINLTFSYRINQ